MVIKDFFSASIPTHRCILSAVLVAAIGAMSVTLVPQWIKKIKKQAVRHDIPEDAPEHCPGVESEQAGKASACAGCPNQNICASGKAVVADPTIGEVHDKMASIRKRVLVLSGKGGVGKSTVSAQLGWLLQSRGFQVGLLDIDVCGPSIPTMTGSRTKDVHASADGWSPIYVRENFAVMSIGYLLPHEDDAVIWRGPKKNGIIRQFLTDVNWGELDVLLIDTPPGTSDEHLSIVTYLTPMSIDGAIIVTTSQHVALRDVRKEINFCKKVGVKIIGVVENMTSSVFDAVCPGAVETMCSEMEVPFVGSVPLDRDLLFACEVGRSIAEVNAQSASAQSLSVVLDKALTTLEMPLLGDFPQEPHNADSTGSEQSVEEQEDKNNVRPALATSSEGFKGEAVTLGYADPQRQPQVKASSLEVTLRREPSPASGGPAVSAAQSRINEDVCKTSPLFPMSA